MTKPLNLNEQSEVLEIVWYLIQDLEEKCLKSKNQKRRKFVTDVYNFLNKVDYTKSRPDWEVTEDPRQTKFKF